MAKIAATAQTKNGASRGAGNQPARTRNDNTEIEALAYQFFVERGYEHGYDQQDWARAEAIVKNRKKA